MSETTPTPATFHPANIMGSPTSTWLGIGMLAQQAGQAVATAGLPTNTQGWVVFGLSILGGLAGIFGR